MGSIPFVPVDIGEPNQRGLIAFNGQEEILVLSTDLKASKPTKVLEVIPLPSEPKVSKADIEMFGKAMAIINRKLARQADDFSFGGGDFGGGGTDFGEPAGRVTLHKRIGAHEIMVAHVERPEGFVQWVQDYLKKQGVDNPRIPPALQAVIGEYMRDNFRWFVFDVVALSPQLTRKDAIQFRFATPFLHYPMRITRAETGFTRVNLLIFSNELFKEWMALGLPRHAIRMLHPAVPFTPKEVHAINPEILSLLQSPKQVLVRNWEIVGNLNMFQDDVIVGDPRRALKHFRALPADK